MFQCKQLSIELIRDGRTLLHDLSLIVQPGDRMAIIGEEGDGKSTLLKLIADPALVAGYASYTGEILRGSHIFGYLAQELCAEEKQQTIRAFFNARGIAEDVDTAFGYAAREGLDFSRFRPDAVVGTLSGGEQVRLQMAAILLAGADFLLLDEPTNDVDLATLEWLESFLNRCTLPMLYVSHDETLLERTANRILHLELVQKKNLPRHTVVQSGYADYIDARTRTVSHQAQRARKEAAELRDKEARWQQIYERVAHEQNAISRGDPAGGRLLKKKMHSVKAQQRRLETEKEDLTALPDLETPIFLSFAPETMLPAGKRVLDFSLPVLAAGDRVLAQNIRLSVSGGEHIAIAGRNGAGKTTLLRQIAAHLLPRRDLRAAYMPQQYADGMDMRDTPVAFLAGNGGKAAVTRARQFLGSVRYTPDEMLSPIGALSGGQKAKLFFVKMIFDGADVLILDEPTRNFSPLSNPVIRDILCTFRGTVIAASHDRKFLSAVCDTVYLLDENGLTKTDRFQD